MHFFSPLVQLLITLLFTSVWDTVSWVFSLLTTAHNQRTLTSQHSDKFSQCDSTPSLSQSALPHDRSHAHHSCSSLVSGSVEWVARRLSDCWCWGKQWFRGRTKMTKSVGAGWSNGSLWNFLATGVIPYEAQYHCFSSSPALMFHLVFVDSLLVLTFGI